MPEIPKLKGAPKAFKSAGDSYVQEVASHFNRWDRLRADKIGGPEAGEAARQCWKHIGELLHQRLRIEGPSSDEERVAMYMLQAQLTSLCDDLSNGVIPSLVKEARMRGRPIKAAEKRQIAYGIYYIERVRRGEISDPSPTERVGRAYGVTAKAVQGWLQRRDDICRNVPGHKLQTSEVVQMMERAGKFYRRTGRGAPGDF